MAVTVTAGQRRAEFAEAAPDQWSSPRCGPVFVNAELSASARPAELCRWSGGSELRPLFGDVHGLARTLLVPNQERGALIARLLLWTNNRYRGEQIGSFPQPCPRLSPKTSPLLEPSLLLQAIPPEYNTLRMPAPRYFQWVAGIRSFPAVK